MGSDGSMDHEFQDAFGDGNKQPFGGMPMSAGLIMMVEQFARAGEHIITGDEIETHDGQKILIPEGMTYERAQSIFDRVRADAETTYMDIRQFPYRADDGAHAAFQVLSRRYGKIMSESRSIASFFGSFDQPAQMRRITTGVGTTLQVPWGSIGIPTLEGVELILCSSPSHSKAGGYFHIHVEAAKKHQALLDGIFDEIEQYLREHSLYRGKAVVGSEDLEFLDLTDFDASKIVFADSVERQFQQGVMTYLRHSEALRAEGVPLKLVTLLWGPHGTGKTSAMQIIAQEAGKHGWTAIFAKTGEDDLLEAIETARTYGPAILFVEDIDVEASTAGDNEIRRMLEAFDGVTGKHDGLMMVLTTNHIDKIHPGLLRPGRFDFTIEVDKLDRGGVERLIKAVVNGDKLAGDIDYDKVGTAMEGFPPAFVKGACDRAVTFSLGRLDGSSRYVISTDDLVAAAESLKAMLGLQQTAAGPRQTPLLEEALTAAVEPAVSRVLARTTAHGPHVGDVELKVGSNNGNGS